MSESVYQRWNNVMGDIRELAKLQTNQHFRFNFRGIDDVMNAVGPALRKHGVMIVPQPAEIMTDTATSSRGQLTQIVRVKMLYTVYGADGDSFTGGAYGEANDQADKATAKAESVAFRTFLLQSLTLPTHDTDPDSEGEQLRQPPQWQVQIDACRTAEEIEGLIGGWAQQREIPQQIQAYADNKIVQLRRTNG